MTNINSDFIPEYINADKMSHDKIFNIHRQDYIKLSSSSGIP